MTIHVQKFGGSSLAQPGEFVRCAQKVAESTCRGDAVVVVVSAMGDTTDELIGLARAITPSPNRQSLDALMAGGELLSTSLMTLTLQSLGIDAAGLTAYELGIRTSGRFGDADITSIDTSCIRAHLSQGRVVVAAGCQGLSPQGQWTTLGRGGSDTTAVALAAALGVNRTSGSCQIFTDVDGVFTADPKLVSGARLVGRIGYEPMIELSSAGAQVLRDRSIDIARRSSVPVRVRSSFSDAAGTVVFDQPESDRAQGVVGGALLSDMAYVRIAGHALDAPTHAPLHALVERGVDVRDIAQTGHARAFDLSFDVPMASLTPARETLIEQISDHEDAHIHVTSGLAKVSVVGVGLQREGHIARKLQTVLEAEGIHITRLRTSDTRISCLVPQDFGQHALQRIHDALIVRDD